MKAKFNIFSRKIKSEIISYRRSLLQDIKAMIFRYKEYKTRQKLGSTQKNEELWKLFIQDKDQNTECLTQRPVDLESM